MLLTPLRSLAVGAGLKFHVRFERPMDALKMYSDGPYLYELTV